MTGTKPVGVYIGIRLMFDFLRNRQGIVVIIILITEKLLHKTSFYIIVFCLHYTLHTLFIIHGWDSLSLTTCKVLRKDPIGSDFHKGVITYKINNYLEYIYQRSINHIKWIFVYSIALSTTPKHTLTLNTPLLIC